MAAPHVLLLTGVPGAGKTTLLRKVAASLSGRRIAGFTTEEIRESGRRVGFRIVPLHGPGRVMAHVDFQSRRRVSNYGVDVAAIDTVVEATLTVDAAVELYLIDEIGKMECFSERFTAAMRRLLDSTKRMIATVARKGGGLIADVKERPDVEIWEVTAANRDALVERVLHWIS